jgi:hypothetical protein
MPLTMAGLRSVVCLPAFIDTYTLSPDARVACSPRVPDIDQYFAKNDEVKNDESVLANGPAFPTVISKIPLIQESLT